MTNSTELQQTNIQPPQRSTTGTIESNRAIAEVQGQILMAKQFPRDQIQNRINILEACKRKRLAETALYSYPRGGTQIEGPSIRLAEMMAQNWGNIDYGVIELEQREGYDKKPGESVVMAYARDIQTNTRQQIVFTVPHVRYTRKSGVKLLSDPRDIYEVVANQGARRLRKCILGIIPGDIVEEAVEACNKTLLGNSSVPLIERITKMVNRFADLGVTQDMIEKRLRHKMEATLEIEIVGLGKIFKSIQDGMSKIEDWFDLIQTVDTDFKAKPKPGKDKEKGKVKGKDKAKDDNKKAPESDVSKKETTELSKEEQSSIEKKELTELEQSEVDFLSAVGAG